jgi:hypothetical protein
VAPYEVGITADHVSSNILVPRYVGLPRLPAGMSRCRLADCFSHLTPHSGSTLHNPTPCRLNVPSLRTRLPHSASGHLLISLLWSFFTRLPPRSSPPVVIHHSLAVALRRHGVVVHGTRFLVLDLDPVMQARLDGGCFPARYWRKIKRFSFETPGCTSA